MARDMTDPCRRPGIHMAYDMFRNKFWIPLSQMFQHLRKLYLMFRPSGIAHHIRTGHIVAIDPSGLPILDKHAGERHHDAAIANTTFCGDFLIREKEVLQLFQNFHERTGHALHSYAAFRDRSHHSTGSDEAPEALVFFGAGQVVEHLPNFFSFRKQKPRAGRQGIGEAFLYSFNMKSPESRPVLGELVRRHEAIVRTGRVDDLAVEIFRDNEFRLTADKTVHGLVVSVCYATCYIPQMLWDAARPQNQFVKRGVAGVRGERYRRAGIL